MKYICIDYPPSARVRIIPMTEVIEIERNVLEIEGYEHLTINIYLKSGQIIKSFFNGAKEDFWKVFEYQQVLYVDHFQNDTEENV